MAYIIDLIGKVAIVTGAAKGIGLTTIKLLAQAGALVVLNEIIPLEQADAAFKEVESAGLISYYAQRNISVEDNCREMAMEVLQNFGRIDILINNAGVVADWDKSYAVHVKDLYFCANAVSGHMMERGEGRIVNITSTCVLTGGTGIPQYVATKAGAFSLTRYLAKNYAPKGILVNGVMPAVIMSDMIMTLYQSEQELNEHYYPGCRSVASATRRTWPGWYYSCVPNCPALCAVRLLWLMAEECMLIEKGD